MAGKPSRDVPSIRFTVKTTQTILVMIKKIEYSSAATSEGVLENKELLKYKTKTIKESISRESGDEPAGIT